jgi:hypothetical protein
MGEIRRGLELGLDVSWYSKPEFDANQMYEIRVGLMKGLEVKWYAKSELNANQMKEIAYWLEKGFNVSDYAHLTFEEMKDYLYCIDSSSYKNKSFT